MGAVEENTVRKHDEQQCQPPQIDRCIVIEAEFTLPELVILVFEGLGMDGVYGPIQLVEEDMYEAIDAGLVARQQTQEIPDLRKRASNIAERLRRGRSMPYTGGKIWCGLFDYFCCSLRSEIG